MVQGSLATYVYFIERTNVIVSCASCINVEGHFCLVKKSEKNVRKKGVKKKHVNIKSFEIHLRRRSLLGQSVTGNIVDLILYSILSHTRTSPAQLTISWLVRFAPPFFVWDITETYFLVPISLFFFSVLLFLFIYTPPSRQPKLGVKTRNELHATYFSQTFFCT